MLTFCSHQSAIMMEGVKIEGHAYRLTQRDITLMIQLRASNAHLFTGKRNSAMRGWRAIRREMGLQGLLSTNQLKRKWENFKIKYKLLKDPPVGMETLTKPSSWRWYNLMDEAMTGRLAGSAPKVTPSILDDLQEEEEHNLALAALAASGGARSAHTNEEAGFSGMSGMSIDQSGTTSEGTWMFGEVVEDEMSNAGSTEEVMEADDQEEVTSPECELTVTVNTIQSPSLYATILPECTTHVETPPKTTANNTIQNRPLYATILPDFPTSEKSKITSPTNTIKNRPLYATILPECSTVEKTKTARKNTPNRVDQKTPIYYSGIILKEAGEVDKKMAEIHAERRALERDQAEFDGELVALERDRQLLAIDKNALERDTLALARDRASIERERVLLDRDRAFLDRDRALLERDRVVVDRDREELEREKALGKKGGGGGGGGGDAGKDGQQAERDILLRGDFYERLIDDLGSDQSENRQRLVGLFQRLVEKM